MSNSLDIMELEKKYALDENTSQSEDSESVQEIKSLKVRKEKITIIPQLTRISRARKKLSTVKNTRNL